jgi:hypothetical protein
MTEQMKESQEREAGNEAAQITANLRAWIHDLRTTDAKQDAGQLRTADDGYCCLGRACVILGADWAKPDRASACEVLPAVVRVLVDGVEDHSYMPAAYKAAMGLTDADVATCVRLNDSERKTFPEIAAWLESEILPRYLTPSAVQEPA